MDSRELDDRDAGVADGRGGTYVPVDHDSLGVSQQRPNQGWGTPQQVRDPVFLANFEDRATVARPPGVDVLAESVARGVDEYLVAGRPR